MTIARSTAQRVRVSTRVVPDVGDLVARLPSATGALCWVNDGDGLVGWGELARFEADGPLRFTRIDAWWRAWSSRLVVDDEAGVPGSGPVAFTSIAFADTPGRSVIVVPRVVVGRRDGVSWVTTLGPDDDSAIDSADDLGAPVEPVGTPGRVRYSDGQLPVGRYREVVDEAVRMMRADRAPGDLAKVVLAHDLVATAERPIDPRFLLRGLTSGYPRCWAFAVDGMVGATPELLVRRAGDRVDARVLAGTAWPHDGVTPDEVARGLLASRKDREEHAYAVRSMVDAMRPFCSPLRVPKGPSVLRLPNVQHLATDITGTLTAGQSVLRLAWLAHPTAAVGGTPSPDACRLIGELENMDRGRYAGPVGWVDADGNGELGIALRSGEVSGRTARLFAGCGVVAGSDPDTEVDEAARKLLPMRQALEATDA